MKETHCGHFPIMFCHSFVTQISGSCSSLPVPKWWCSNCCATHAPLTEHASRLLFSLQTNSIWTIHSDFNGCLNFFGFFVIFPSYIFNLFYWFILVMRNNIKIVEFLFFLFFQCWSFFSLWYLRKYTCKTDTELQAICFHLLSFFLFIRECSYYQELFDVKMHFL